jgi:hypothetical protein
MAAPKNAECAYLAPDDPAVQALVDIYGADRVVPSPLSVRLPAPLAHVALGVNSHILDDAASVGPLNDERVWRWLIGPPYPYAVEHSEAWTALQMAEAAKILDELRAGVRWTTGNPLHILRVEEEGGWRRIGACDIARSGFLDLAADEAKARREANNALPIGDPKIVWQPGCAFFSRCPSLLSSLLISHPHCLFSPSLHVVSPPHICLIPTQSGSIRTSMPAES